MMEFKANANDTKNNKKIGKVLQKLLEPNFKIRTDVYLNQFLTHLIGKKDDDDEAAQNLTNQQLKEQFCQWIIQASIVWSQQKENPQAAILSFALNLTSHLSADELIFVRLNCQNVYESLVGVARINSTHVSLGFITLLCSFLEHKSGLQWIMSATYWSNIIILGLKAHTTHVRTKAYHFVMKLLEKTICFNRNFGVHVVQILIKPLKDALRNLLGDKNTRHTEAENGKLYENLKPTLDFILGVIEPLLRNFNSKVLQLFLEQHAPEITEKLHLLSRGEELSFRLLQIQFVFLFHKLYKKLVGVKVVAYNSPIVFDYKLMFDLITNEIDKNYVRCVVKICGYANDLSNSLAPRMPTLINNGTIIEFQIQMMFFEVLPIGILSFQMMSDQKIISMLLNDVFRNDFYQRWYKQCATEIMKMYYKWEKSLKTKPDLVDDAVFCLQRVPEMKRLLNKERAGMIFPALVYSLCDALTTMKEASPQAEFIASCTMYLKTIMDAIVDLVESFDLTWKDSVETIQVMDCAYDLLQYPNWDDEMIIKGLKLLNTTISKYMSPDMVLLMYNTEDSKISQTGSFLYAKCHNISWKIRDSALEVVYSLSLNANTKFPAYTYILLNAKLPQLVVNMAFKDGEHYVRATAFKCLQELIQISEIWNEILRINNVLDDLLDVLQNETEGLVRKEAAALIHKIDKYQSFPEEMLPRLYDIMTRAAIGDVHWKVKFNALDFWFNIWDKHLINQGMLDRTFPSHTFSKEHKKIVALNSDEVKKRIIKVLNQLAEIGCLYVMKCAVQDDCDVEVSKKATSFTFIMLKMFKSYKISCENVDQSQPQSPVILQNTISNHPVIKPDSTTDITSHANIGNLGSPLFSNSPFFDPVSPIAGPYSPPLDHSVIIPQHSYSSSSTNTKNSSPQEQLSDGNSTHEQVPLISTTQSHTSVTDSAFNQFSNSPFCDPVSPFADPYNHSLDLGVITLPISTTSHSLSSQHTQSSSPQYLPLYGNSTQQQVHTIPAKNQSQCGNSTQQQVSCISTTQSSASVNNSSSTQVTPTANQSNEVDMLIFDPALLEDIAKSNGLDLNRTDQVMEEFLNSNDAALLEQIGNPTDRVTNNTTTMKTNTYLAPSQYLKFVYNEIETRAMERTQSLNSLDQFDSLLDDILKEYNIDADANSMDCY